VRDIEVKIPLKPNTRARDLNVDLHPDYILVEFKLPAETETDPKQEKSENVSAPESRKILDKKLSNRIKVDECWWEIIPDEDVLLLQLCKWVRADNKLAKNSQADTWWKGLFIDDPEMGEKFPPTAYYHRKQIHWKKEQINTEKAEQEEQEQEEQDEHPEDQENEN